LGQGRFEDVSARLGPGLAKPLVGRGAAYADFDNDGDPDILLSANHGPARLLRNDAPPAANQWIKLRLEGVRSNRSAFGAVAHVASAGGRQWAMVKSGSSYCSQSDFVLAFGLGSARSAEVEIDWPSGLRQRLGRLEARKTYWIVEGRNARPVPAERE